MAITAEELIRLIETDPELKRALQDRLVDAEAIQRALRDPAKRDEIRRVVLGDEWVDAPALLREIITIQRQQSEQIAALLETQRQHEALLREHTSLLREHSQILREHTQQLAMLIEAQQRHEALLQEHSQILREHTQQLAMLIEAQQRHETILQEHTQQLAMLIEAQQRHEALLQEHSQILREHTQQLAMLIEAQQRHETILQEHTQQLAMLIEAQQRHEAILQEHSQILREHTQQLAMLAQTQQRHEAILQEHTQILQEHSRILQEHTQQLAMLIETQQRHEAILQEHTQILQEHSRILQEHTQQLAMLIETQQRHETILQEHSAMLIRIENTQRTLQEQFAGLSGQFQGERYARTILRRAPAIFNGGEGGAPDSPAVRRRLKQWFRRAYGEIPSAPEDDDVYAADIIWWKNGNVLVGEISLKVDRLDVLRARRRAEALRRAGVTATPVVIGTEWALDETREFAEQERVEWVVGGEFSSGMRDYRRIPEAPEDLED